MDTFQAGTKGYEQTLSSRLGEGTGEARHDTSDGCLGNYPKAEGHVVLFEQFRREQAQRQQAAKEAETFYRSREWRRLRYQAFQRYGNKCCVCGRGASDGMVMHVDHIKPRSLYPHLALDIANLQIMCNECNVIKGNRDEVAWQ
ncbi:HNH endonuclease [Klebsiella variicola]|nr:HNH endonuclease [Klebsiella variicola]